MKMFDPETGLFMPECYLREKTQIYVHYKTSLHDINVGKRGKLGFIDVVDLYKDFQPKMPKK